jgi:hypothetical protein
MFRFYIPVPFSSVAPLSSCNELEASKGNEKKGRNNVLYIIYNRGTKT